MLLVIVDIYSRWTEIVILNKTTSREIEQALLKWFSKYGRPEYVLSDQGKQFTSKSFKEFLQANKIVHVTSSAYNPTGNSVVERINQTIGNSLRCVRHLPLKEAVKLTVKGICHSYHQTLGHSPFEVLYKKNPFNTFVNVNIKKGEISRRKKVQSTKDLKRISKNRIEHLYRPGDTIYVKSPSHDKLDPRWLGPYRIKSVNHRKNYVIITRHRKLYRINFKRIRPLQTRVDYHVPRSVL